jgi:hypothetical protein
VSHQLLSGQQFAIPVSGGAGWLQRKGRTHAGVVASEPGDAYESEADRVAEQVIREPATSRPLRTACACGDTHGSAGECVACRLKRLSATPRAAETCHPPPSAGQPLDPATRAFFEPRFGCDFSHVRVHTDAHAAQSANVVNALAYTIGRDVVFGEGRYRPATESGRRLIAHELAHVVQQGGRRSVMQRKAKEKVPCAIHAYDASNPKDTAVIPEDDSGIGVTSVANMVSKVNAHVSDDKNGCSCVSRLEVNGHGTDGYQSVGNGDKYVNDGKAIVYNSTDEHLNQLTKIKFCSRALFMLLGCHVGQGNGKILLSKLANLLPGKLVGGAQHYTAGTGLGEKKVTGEGDKPGQPMGKRDPFLKSAYVRWHLVIDGKEYVIPGNETTTPEGKSKLKAAAKIKVKTPEGVEIIK